jgi:hypothetical protein
MSETALSEKRRYQPRLPVKMAARIMAPNQTSPAPCLVLEISQFGAKLQVESCWIIPRMFWLRLEGDAHLHPCIVAWRDDQFIGIDFQQGNDNTWWKHCRAAATGQLPTRARL